jgi:DNA (cytosine-5)-methyltransferase 1
VREEGEKLKLLDLFSGIGGFSHGLVSAGMELVGFCEIDKYAHRAFQILHDPEERLWHEYDVRTIDPVRLPDFDAMCFGWPCQDNSIAGNRVGQREGTRSGLLYEATRILRAKKPKYFIAENVLGLLSVSDGKDFYATIREFTDVGYDVQWGVLNSSNYVPQNRERIFFVGHLRGQRRPEVFPFSESDGLSGESGQAGALEDKRIVSTLTRKYGSVHSGGETYIKCINPRKEDGTQTYQQDRIYEADGILPALTSQLDGRFNIAIGGNLRRLTPLECFRLQSFPDEWYYTLKSHDFKDAPLYKMAGNAVTSRVAYEIGRRLMA